MEKRRIGEVLSNVKEQLGDFVTRLVVIPDDAFAPYPDIEDTQEMDLSELRDDLS